MCVELYRSHMMSVNEIVEQDEMKQDIKHKDEVI